MLPAQRELPGSVASRKGEFLMAVTDTTSRVDIGRERLAAAVDALVSSDQWTAWLESRARFRDYSLGNTMLIAYQRPDATRVAGYKAWQSLGRQVRTGEKGLAILAPMVRKVATAAGEKVDARDDSGRVIVRFRTVWCSTSLRLRATTSRRAHAGGSRATRD